MDDWDVGLDNDILAAMVYRRFNCNHDAAREAWSRMLQNHGWDDTADMRREWVAMVNRGLAHLRYFGHAKNAR